MKKIMTVVIILLTGFIIYAKQQEKVLIIPFEDKTNKEELW